MSRTLPFHVQNFNGYCKSLHRIGLYPGYVMYTNHHASNHQPAARIISADHLDAAQAHAVSPSDETFMRLVKLGALLDTEWDRGTKRWEIISFEGWEVLHQAFSHLHTKTEHSLLELTGVSDLAFPESPSL